jgi:hypothetical protein
MGFITENEQRAIGSQQRCTVDAMPSPITAPAVPERHSIVERQWQRQARDTLVQRAELEGPADKQYARSIGLRLRILRDQAGGATHWTRSYDRPNGPDAM